MNDFEKLINKIAVSISPERTNKNPEYDIISQQFSKEKSEMRWTSHIRSPCLEYREKVEWPSGPRR